MTAAVSMDTSVGPTWLAAMAPESVVERTIRMTIRWRTKCMSQTYIRYVALTSCRRLEEIGQDALTATFSEPMKYPKILLLFRITLKVLQNLTRSSDLWALARTLLTSLQQRKKEPAMMIHRAGDRPSQFPSSDYFTG